MSIVSVKEISKDFGIKPLFNKLTFVVKPNERLSIIGKNGSGKSTLLRMIEGEEHPDSGSIIRQRGLRIRRVQQQEVWNKEETILEYACTHLEKASVPEHIIVQRLLAVGFVNLEQSIHSLSGGWKKRLSIITALLEEPELLLLDEPTNHLDTPGIVWLEESLCSFKGACVFVSHDRYFIERVAQRTIELNSRYPGGFLEADGGYSALLEKREQVLNTIEVHRSSLANKVRREVEWLRQGVKARSTKAKYRIDEAHRLISDLNSIEREGNAASLEFSVTGRKTKQLLKTEDLSGGYQDLPLFSKLNLVLLPGVRLGIAGANGSGKTTLLKTLVGEIAPLKGKIIRASNLKVEFFGQMREQLDPQKTVKEVLAPHTDTVIFKNQEVHVVTWAQRFLFKNDQLQSLVGDLSGGEQSRLLLAKLSLVDADILVFDEPTNDLDIPTLEVLEQSFVQFPGSIVLVTHDRYLLDRVSTTLIGFLPQGGTVQCADYTQFEIEYEKGKQLVPVQKEAKGTAFKETSRDIKLSLTYQEQKELQSIERKISTMEGKVQSLEREMEGTGSDAAKLLSLQDQHLKVAKELDALLKRWSELESKRSDSL